MYDLLNIKWGESTLGTESGPVTWSDDLSGLPVASGSTTNDLVNSLQTAFQAWEDVAALDFQEAGGGVDITISYASFSTDSDSFNDGAAGTATWTPTGGGLNEPVDVRIEFNSDYSWSPFEDSNPSTVNFFVVALHEIGHVIGLGHVNDPTQIMNPVVSASELGDGDIEGAQVLYGLDAGDEPVDGGSGGGKGGEAAVDDGDGGGAGAGLLLGLLALVVGLFTGGMGAAAIMAAGHVATEDDDTDDADESHEGLEAFAESALDYIPALPVHDHHDGCAHEVAEDGSITHYLFLDDDLALPMVDHEVQPKGCGCFGQCEHGHDHDHDVSELAMA